MSVKTRYGGAKEFPWDVYAKGQHITSVYGPGAGATAETMQANARLIAASPSMYDALAAIANMQVQETTDFRELAALCISIAHIEIAKLEGRS